MTGLPTGLSMNLQHTWQGDLSIFIIACGQTLMVLNRPGVIGSCGGGCPCGNPNDIGTPGNPVLVTFSDGGGPDPENGIALAGGNYGVTADNSCGVSTVSSFAQLWSNCPPGNITAQVCIADHAGADVGVAANVTFMYPNPVICGCTNPNSPNYNPNANVDDGSCIPNCAAMNVSATPSNAVACPGGTVSITTSVTGNPVPTITYAWSGPNVGFLSSATSPNPTVNIPAGFSGTLTFNLLVTSGPCTRNTSVSITVTPPPPPVINGPPGICTGQGTAVLTVSGTYNSYAWASPPGGSSPTIVVSTPGNYTVTVTDANGCSSSGSFTLNAYPPPFVQITGPPNVCLGGTATLSAGAGFNSYQWSTGSTSPNATVTQPGIYSVTVTDANGCSNSAQYTLTTAPAPVPGISGGNQICPNSTLTLSAEFGYSNFQWSTGSNASSIVITGPGVYSLTATNSDGCIGTNSITVTALNITQPSIQGLNTICPGAQNNLSVQPSYSSYQWSNGQGSQAITVNQAGTYSVTVTNAQGCSATASFNIAQAAAPTPAISGNLTVCPGQNAVLSAGGPYASYQWSDGSTSQMAVISQPGPVSVTVTNSQGCAGVANATIVQAPVPNPNITGPAQVCPGQTATLNAGAGFNSYNWSNGANLAQVTVNVPNTYSVTVTNAQGCSASASFTLSPAPVPNPSITGNLTICQGASTTLSTEAGFSTYAWSGGGNGPSISASAAGTYTVTVTNSAGCSATASAVLTVNSNPNPAISGLASFCLGGNTTLSSVGDFSAYSWSTGAQSSSITVNTAGAYALTVTDVNGCTGSTSINVQQLAAPAPQITGATAFCDGASTTLSAGVGYVTYQWSDGGGNGQTAVFSATGTYSVTVSDANGCTGSASVTVNELPPVAVSITGDAALCAGQSSALLMASAGFSSYLWSNGQTTQQVSVNTGGAYQVTVTDSNGCFGTASATVTAYVPPSVSIGGALQYCQGSSTVLTATAGLNTYQWSNGASGASITASSPGAYTVAVTDANGCSAQATVNVVQNPNPVPQISGSNQFCAGGQTTLTVTGGNFNTYLWSTSATQPSITVSNQGNYSVTVTDANGCSASAARSVAQVPLPTPQINGLLSICQGQSTMLSAGGGNFTGFAWTGGSTTNQITVSSGGVYSLTVTDANGCSASTSVTVTVNALPVFSIEGTPAFCAGASTSLSAPAGFTAYAWSNASSNSIIAVNAPGSYSVTVTDANGCSSSQSINVVQNANPAPSISGVLQICPGGSTTLNAGGNAVSYQWSNGQTTPSINVSAAGSYSLTITDANGCTGSTATTITQVPQLQPVISGVLYFCAGTSTVLDAGTGYATYRWSNNLNSQQLTVSTPGTYGLTVTDANGCSGQASVSVTERPLPMPQITGTLQYCQGGSTTLSVSAVFQSYQWSTGATVQNITLSTPGTVGLTVTDAFGCSGTTSVNVVENPLVFPNITGNLSFCQGLQTTLNAGAGFATYQWSNNASTPSITVTSGGNYGVTVTDANGCVTNSSVSVTEFPVITPQITGTFAFCTGQSTMLDAGTGYVSYQWSNSASGRIISVSQGGFYGVTATDNNGCISSSGVQVTQHPLPNVQIGGSASFCVGGFTTLNAGSGFAQYLWSNGSTAPTIQVSQPGVVSVTVTDSNGCVNSDVITITQDTELSPQINGNLQFCPGTQTTLDAGAGYATYQWSNNAGTQSITVTQPGTYRVTVTDAFGCFGSGSVQVGLFPQPQPQIAGTPSFCAGASTTLSSAAPFTAYRWSTGAIQPQITVSAPGVYALTVTDANGCSAAVSQAVQEFPLPVFSISGVNFFCAGASTAVSVPPNFTAYSWSNAQTTPGITVNTPGTYVVTVTNNFGCTASQSISIAQIPLPVADAGPARELTCNAPTTILGGSATSQGAAYVYQWSGPGITTANRNLRQPQVNLAGAYSLMVTDSVHGCVSLPASTSVADLTALPAVAAAALDTLDCVTPAVVISGAGSATGADIAYQWLGANQTPISGANAINYTAVQPGQYTLRVRNTYTGCTSERAVIVLQDVEIPAAEAGTPRHLTCLVTSDALNGAGSATGNTIVYQWTTQGGNILSGATTLTPIVNLPGLYTLRVTNQRNGCFNTDTVRVTQDIVSPVANAGQDREIDCLNPSVRIDGAGSSNGASVRYEWTRNGDPLVVSSALSFEATLPGTYTLRVINLQNGCSASDVMVVTENAERPRALNVVTDNPTCFGDTDGSILIGGITGGTPPYLYSMNGSPFRAQTFYPNLGGGNYQIVVQDATGCELTLSTNLREGNALVLDLGPDQFIRLGQRARIEAQYNIPQNEVRSFRWSTADTLPCLNCTELNLRPFVTTTYAAELVDTNGCRISDQVTIYVEKPFEIFVPTAFSPNNDGTNDRLLVFAGEDVEYIRAFQVFNRWGESTFEVYNFPPNDPAYGWDGSQRNKQYNANVFVWYAEVLFIDGTVKLFKGDVTLMR